MGRVGKGILDLLRMGMPEGVTYSNLPIVELAGEGRVLIEHHQGVVAYSLEEIRIRVSYGSVLISGNGLKISEMRRMQLIVVGKIDKIILERR